MGDYERMLLKPYHGEYIKVIGNLIRRGKSPHSYNWLLSDVWHYDGDKEYLCDHAWFYAISLRFYDHNGLRICSWSSDDAWISRVMFQHIRQKCFINDFQNHSYDFPDAYFVETGKRYIKYEHKVVVEVKVIDYSDGRVNRFGLGYLREQKVYFVENDEMIVGDSEKGVLFSNGVEVNMETLVTKPSL